MNWLDLSLLVFLFFFVIGGWRKGLIRGVFEILGLVAAIILGGKFSHLLVPYLLSQDIVRLSETVAEFLAFIIVFIFVLLCVSLLARIIRLLARVVLLGWLDRLGGLVFGLAEGLVFASLLLSLLTYFPIIPSLNRALTESRLAGPVQKITPRLFGALRDRYPYFEDLGKKLPGSVVLGPSNTGLRQGYN